MLKGSLSPQFMALIEGQVINNQAEPASSAGAAGPKKTAPGAADQAEAAAAPNKELDIGLLDGEVDELFGDQDLALQFLDDELFKGAT